MSLTNDKIISLEINKNQIQYDDINLITSNPRIMKSKESSIVEISSKDKSTENTENISTELILGSPIYFCNPRKIGSVKAFFYIKGFPIIIIGPDCKLLFYLIIYVDKYSIFLFFFSVILYLILSKLFFDKNLEIIVKIEKISFLAHIITFIIAFLLNPGIPNREYYKRKFEKEYKGDFSKLIYCDKCNITIPKTLNVGHCIYCNICIQNYDHHCPWIGKCIGKYNRFPFYFFLICILFYIISSIITFFSFLRNKSVFIKY